MPIEPTPPLSLHAETLRLARAHKGSQIELADAAGVTYFWLRSFLTERTTAPDVNRVQKLYEYLSGKAVIL